MIGHPGVIVAGAAIAASGVLLGHLSDILVVVGIVVFAFASLKSRSPSILRAENKDLVTRNETLVATARESSTREQQMQARIIALEARTDLAPLLDSMKAHDERTLAVHVELMKALEGIVRHLDEIRAAVVPPPTRRLD